MLTGAYLVNILILAPVSLSLLAGRHENGLAAFDGKVRDEPALRLLVASLWGGILLCSVLGLFQPLLFVPVLLLQVMYKALFLGLYVLPQARVAGWRSVPLGVSASFAAIVLVWPFLIASAWLPSAAG